VNNVNGKESIPMTDQPNPELMSRAEAQAIMNELVVQKNMLTDRCVSLSVQLQAAQKQVSDLEAEVTKLKAVAAKDDPDTPADEARRARLVARGATPKSV
jgi:cell division protein FtsB